MAVGEVVGEAVGEVVGEPVGDGLTFGDLVTVAVGDGEAVAPP